jgi:ADP-ribosyl-[dinitrogen reductase] hydrolase
LSENEKTLACLFEKQKIDIQRGKILDSLPEAIPKTFDFRRIEGMMLGLAMGDALGNTTEGMPPRRRRSIHGEIKTYLPSRRGSGAIGLPSDDTQLTFWTLEQMLKDGVFVPENVAARLSEGRIFGIGATVNQFLRNYQSGRPWYECGPKSAGNGALMRIAPMLIPHLKSGTRDLWVDTTLSAMMTHNDAASISACLAFINIFWHLLKMNNGPPAEWWVDTYIQTAEDLELDATYESRSRAFSGFRGSLCQFVCDNVRRMYDRNISIVDACDLWYSGAYLLETVPSVLLILMRFGHDPAQAIIRAVNDTVDNDTIAATVGAAVGALHGKDCFPKEWISNLSGRTTDRDDGRIFELLKEAEDKWWMTGEQISDAQSS